MTETKVKDVMTRTVVVARGETPFKELARLMHEHRVSGLPIVDAEERIVGIVTEADLLMAEEYEPPGRSLFLEWFIDPKRLAEIERRADDLRARDVMTRDPVTVTPDTTAHEAARKMLDEGIKRLPVVDDAGTVLGIVSRRDLLTPYLRADEDIRREVDEELLLRTMWIDPRDVAVEVRGGVVRLRGVVPTRSAKEILLELVHRVDGVVGVEEELSYHQDDREIRMPEGIWARAER